MKWCFIFQVFVFSDFYVHRLAPGFTYLHICFIYITICIITITKSVPDPTLRGIWTCNEPVVCERRRLLTYACLHTLSSLFAALSAPLAHHLLSCCFVFFLSSLCPRAHLTSHRTSMKGAGCITVCVCVCVCVCMTHCAPAESPTHHKDLSIWSAPSAIKTGSVYTWGRTLSFPLSFCHSQFVSPSSVSHTHTHTHTQLTRMCSHTTAPGFRVLLIETSARV